MNFPSYCSEPLPEHAGGAAAAAKRPAEEPSVAGGGARRRRPDRGENETVPAATSSPLPQDAPWISDPRFTPRDEEREWAAVTPAEMAEIESDLKGLSVTGGGCYGGDSEAWPTPSECLSSPGVAVGLPGGVGNIPAVMTTPEIAEEMDVGEEMGLAIGPVTYEVKEEAMLPLIEAELAGIPDDEKAGYLEAQRKCPDQVGDEHKKAFLMKENFHPKLAAERLVRHWKYKRKLFGPAKCYLPMTLSGAMSDDMVALSEGFIQLLPVKDEHGRAIIFVTTCRLDLTKYSRDSMTRAFWYLVHVAIEDPSVRRRGIVFIFNNRGMSWEKFDPKTYRQIAAILFHYTAPLGRAMHCCHPTYYHHVVTPVIKMMLRHRGRKRLRFHSGSDEEVLRSLAEFGLGRDRMPRELGGTVDANPVHWLSNRMLTEASNGWESTDLPLLCVDGLDVGELGEEGDDIDSIFSSMSAEEKDGGVEHTEPLHHSEPKHASAVGENIQSLRKDFAVDKPQHLHLGLKATLSLDIITADQTIHQKGSQHGNTVHSSGSQTNSEAMPVRRTQASESQRLLETKPSTTPASAPTRRKSTKKSPKGRDPRMDRAIQARLNDPCLSLLDALIAGGFDYPETKERGTSDKDVRDSENVTLHQRKNQLCRRLRNEQKQGLTQGADSTPITRRLRVDPKQGTKEDAYPLSNAPPPSNFGNGKRNAKKSKGRYAGDPRMVRALDAKVANPRLSLLEALVFGGFSFPRADDAGLSDKENLDSDGVSLFQRKNQLCRRLRTRSAEDPRMCRAVEAKLENPQMSLADALVAGGFRFPELLGKSGSFADVGEVRDSENVSLLSRKSELERRVKITRARGNKRVGSAVENVTVVQMNEKQEEKQSALRDKVRDVRTQKLSGMSNTCVVGKGCSHSAVCSGEKDEQMMCLWLWGAEERRVTHIFPGF